MPKNGRRDGGAERHAWPRRAATGEYRVGYISQDGMRHQVSLADTQAVRFEVMSPVGELGLGAARRRCAAVRSAAS